jgi:hypothetical protein
MVGLEGGDPHPQMRFLLPLVPLLALHVAVLLHDGRVSVRVFAGILAGLALLAQFAGKEPWHGVWPLNSGNRVEALTLPIRPAAAVAGGLLNLSSGKWPVGKSNYAQWNAASRHLGEILRPDVTVAATDVGALAYYSRLKILDAQGLNDREIAHIPKPPGDANVWGVEHWEVVVARGAQVIVPGLLDFADTRLTDLRIDALSTEEWERLFTRPLPGLFSRVRGVFTCVSIEDAAHRGRYLNLLVRRELVTRVWRVPPAGLSVADCW